MKYLKIENNKGHYFNQEGKWIEIDKISKDDLQHLLNKAVSSKFEMDEISDQNIGHKAHQIVYKNIYEKFSNLLKKKDSFRDECDSQFKSAIEKYQDSVNH